MTVKVYPPVKTLPGPLRGYLPLFPYSLVAIGVLGFDSQGGLGIFLFATMSRTALGPTHSMGTWDSSTSGREADHSPTSSAEVKECVELYLHIPLRLHGVELS